MSQHLMETLAEGPLPIDILAMVFHNDVDEIVDTRWLLQSLTLERPAVQKSTYRSRLSLGLRN